MPIGYAHASQVGMKLQLHTFLFGCALSSLLPFCAKAEIWAYTSPAQINTQQWGGNLGLDFHVNQAIVVTSLGVFNAAGTAFISGGPINVAIFSQSGVLLTPVVQFTNGGSPYTLNPGGNDVSQSLGSGVLLDIGDYSVVAVGFGGSNPNGNLNLGSAPVSVNDGGGLLTFTGSRWDNSPSLQLPTDNTGLPYNQFDAGTFGFEAVPEPGTWMLAGVGTLLTMWQTVRRKV
jgi:hypothetical protein